MQNLRIRGGSVTTHWSVVLAAGQGDAPDAQAALEQLCRTYWYPLYAFVRRLGHAPPDAEDLVQSFFASVLEKKSLRHADPLRGRFRTFLLACLKNFMAKEWQRRRAGKRGGGTPVFSLDQLGPEATLRPRKRPRLDAGTTLRPRVGVGRVERVRDRLRDDYARRGQAQRFALLESFLPGETSELTYAEAGRQLGLSEGSVKAEVHRLKQRYRSWLRTMIAPTVTHLDEVDDELRALFAALSV